MFNVRATEEAKKVIENSKTIEELEHLMDVLEINKDDDMDDNQDVFFCGFCFALFTYLSRKQKIFTLFMCKKIGPHFWIV